MAKRINAAHTAKCLRHCACTEGQVSMMDDDNENISFAHERHYCAFFQTWHFDRLTHYFSTSLGPIVIFYWQWQIVQAIWHLYFTWYSKISMQFPLFAWLVYCTIAFSYFPLQRITFNEQLFVFCFVFFSKKFHMSEHVGILIFWECYINSIM